MDKEMKELVELEVRRLLSEGELEIRKNIAEEISGHRAFLQGQFKTITWGIGILFAAAGAIFIFLFGKSYESSREQLIQEVDSKVIEYRIVDLYKDRLEAQVELIVDGEETRSKIEENIKNAVSVYVTENVDSIVEERVTDKLGELDAETIHETLSRITDQSESAIKRTEEIAATAKHQSDRLMAEVEVLGGRIERLRFRDRRLRDSDEQFEEFIEELRESNEKLRESLEDLLDFTTSTGTD